MFTVSLDCELVGQFLRNPDDPCTYLVCDYGPKVKALSSLGMESAEASAAQPGRGHETGGCARGSLQGERPSVPATCGPWLASVWCISSTCVASSAIIAAASIGERGLVICRHCSPSQIAGEGP